MKRPTSRRKRIGIFVGVVALLGVTLTVLSQIRLSPQIGAASATPAISGTALSSGGTSDDSGGVGEEFLAALPATDGDSTHVTTAPISTALPEIHYPLPQRLQLPNGLHVLLFENHRLPYIYAALSVNAGQIHEQKRGVATAAGELLMVGGAGKRSGARFLAEAAADGVRMDVTEANEATILHSEGPSESLKTQLASLADAVQTPLFEQASFDNWQNRSAQHAANENDTRLVKTQVVHRLFYDHTGYFPMALSSEEYLKLTRDDLVAFHNRRYRPEGAVLALTGDFDASIVTTQIKQLFQDWHSTGKPEKDRPPTLTPPPGRYVCLFDFPESKNCTLYLEAIAVPRHDPDFYPLLVANRILGGTSGSRLYTNLRENRALTYNIRSNVTYGNLCPGVWETWATVPAATAGIAVQECLHEYQRMRDEPVSPEELNRAKQGLIGGQALGLERTGSVMETMLEDERVGIPLNEENNWGQKIARVTAADIQRVARRYLPNDAFQILVIGPRSTIEKQVVPFGTVWPLNQRGANHATPSPGK